MTRDLKVDLILIVLGLSVLLNGLNALSLTARLRKIEHRLHEVIGDSEEKPAKFDHWNEELEQYEFADGTPNDETNKIFHRGKFKDADGGSK